MDTWTNEAQQTCWHIDDMCPTCGGPVATNGTDLWCCACKARLVRKVLCDVYSRIVGYIRPVRAWNDAKRSEFYQRQTYVIGAIQ